MQSIVVYRNPAEAAFWQIIMDGVLVGPIVTVLLFLILVYLIHTHKVAPLTKRHGKNSSISKWASNLNYYGSAIIAVAIGLAVSSWLG